MKSFQFIMILFFIVFELCYSNGVIEDSRVSRIRFISTISSKVIEKDIDGRVTEEINLHGFASEGYYARYFGNMILLITNNRVFIIEGGSWKNVFSSENKISVIDSNDITKLIVLVGNKLTCIDLGSLEIISKSEIDFTNVLKMQLNDNTFEISNAKILYDFDHKVYTIWNGLNKKMYVYYEESGFVEFIDYAHNPVIGNADQRNEIFYINNNSIISRTFPYYEASVVYSGKETLYKINILDVDTSLLSYFRGNLKNAPVTESFLFIDNRKIKININHFDDVRLLRK